MASREGPVEALRALWSAMAELKAYLAPWLAVLAAATTTAATIGCAAGTPATTSVGVVRGRGGEICYRKGRYIIKAGTMLGQNRLMRSEVRENVFESE